jgi:hypothetical protein
MTIAIQIIDLQLQLSLAHVYHGVSDRPNASPLIYNEKKAPATPKPFCSSGFTTYFSELLMLVNLPLRFCPSPLTTATIS